MRMREGLYLVGLASDMIYGCLVRLVGVTYESEVLLEKIC
jgi:hypothetical protein